VLSSLESHVLPLVPELAAQFDKGIRMLDVGCGSGRIINRLAEQYPDSQFTGMDLSPEAIGYARGEAAQKRLRNTEFIICDMSDFHDTAVPEAFNFITTFDAIHPRSGQTAQRAERHPSHAEGRWGVLDAGYSRIKPRLQ